MSTPEKHPGLPPEADARLDDLLASWASRHRLSPARTQAIRSAILASPATRTGTPANLGWEWWQTMMSPLATALSHAAPRPAPSGPVFDQPYLRLT